MAGLSRPVSRAVEAAISPAAMAAPASWPGGGGAEYVLLDPTREEAISSIALAPRTGEPQGDIGLLEISKPKGDIVLDTLQGLLKARFPQIAVRRFIKPTFSRPAPDALRAEIVASSVRHVIAALAD